MSQSRAMSRVEAATDVAVGFVTALLVQIAAFPVIGLQATAAQNLTLSGVFTGVSLARSYLLRRVFSRLAAQSLRGRGEANRGRGGMKPCDIRPGTGAASLLQPPAKFRTGYRPASVTEPASNIGPCGHPVPVMQSDQLGGNSGPGPAALSEGED